MGTATVPRLTSLSHGAGCACKLSLDELLRLLPGVGPGEHPDLVVGFATGDDAAVWRRPDGRHLVATTDFFTPIVDDPATWGRVAAANAVSDVYAMGATPLFALNVLGWPRDLPFELLGQVLEGASEVARQAGYVVAGGHSIDSAEPLYGQAIVGEVVDGDPLTNAGGRVGDVLVLSKALGTGIATTAAKRCDPDRVGGQDAVGRAYRAAVASMTRLNAAAARAARDARATACTDVTGFGLLGHAHRLALASGLTVSLDASSVPVLPGVEELRDAGFVPGGTRRNAEQAARYLDGDVDGPLLTVLADAQTSGGLLFSCPPGDAEAAVAGLRDQGHDAAIVGQLHHGSAGRVTVR